MPLTNASLERRISSFVVGGRRDDRPTERPSLVLDLMAWQLLHHERRSCVLIDHRKGHVRRAEREEKKKISMLIRNSSEIFTLSNLEITRRTLPLATTHVSIFWVVVAKWDHWRIHEDTIDFFSPWNFKFPRCKTADNNLKISFNSSSLNINTLQALLIVDHSLASSRLSQ